MILKADKVSTDFLRVIQEGSYLIHSVFSHGCNIRIGKRLCFIGNKGDMELPYGILLKKSDLVRFYKLAVADCSQFFWNGSRKQLSSAYMTIEVGEAEVFSSDIPDQSKKITNEDVHLLMQAAEDHWMTGFGVSLKDIKKRQWGPAVSLSSCFLKEKDETLAILKRWVGSGIGLTPSGDDFLYGILYVDRLHPILGSRFRSALQQLISQEYTTDVSIHFYLCALEGKFNDLLTELTVAIKNKNLQKVRTNLEKVISIGHSSGKDMVAGIMEGFLYAADLNM